ncbi:hypothetical protein VTI74DRAFT_3805 [Chaetomium olivicolor]
MESSAFLPLFLPPPSQPPALFCFSTFLSYLFRGLGASTAVSLSSSIRVAVFLTYATSRVCLHVAFYRAPFLVAFNSMNAQTPKSPLSHLSYHPDDLAGSDISLVVSPCR